MSSPSIAICIPTWNRGQMFRDSLYSLINQDYEGSIDILVVDDQSTDDTKSIFHGAVDFVKNRKVSGQRNLRWQNGPGKCNWRPGSIHQPFFTYALTSKCEFVGYQFSDDISPLNRIRLQVEAMNIGQAPRRPNWTYAAQTVWIDKNAKVTGVQQHFAFHPRDLRPMRSPQLPVYSFLIRREPFVEAGGCDYPYHAGACAEAWIIAHCALTGIPTIHPQTSFQFRRHDEALGAQQGPNSETYHLAVAETGFYEEDHWKLWTRIEPLYNARVQRARDIWP